MTKGKGDNSPKQHRPDQDRSWRDINSQDDQLNNSNRHNNNPPYEGSPETRSNPNTSGSQNQKSANDDHSKSTGAGVSGRPNSELSHSGNQGKNAPNYQDGPVAGGADNTRGENKPSREGHGGGAKKGKVDPEKHTPQGSHSNPSDTRGADSSDKEFRNNQPNSSTLKGHKNEAGLGNEKE
ncbi:hypothetical protein [Sabulibacter ruber]|uniref:hypothetical protein n=1 Tax=Sabulibacter ruber TaxID=2811901 RepID=UPI001F608319|nr:hypothetical protein [Sabulibacter ruber]